MYVQGVSLVVFLTKRIHPKKKKLQQTGWEIRNSADKPTNNGTILCSTVKL